MKRRSLRLMQRRMFGLATLFLRLGTAGFGGPQAHIALMQRVCVDELEWVDEDRFTDGLAVCSLLPGPTSTELAIWLGYMRAGPLGGILAGIAFTLPAFALVLALASLLGRYGQTTAVGAFMAGVQPAVIAVVLATCLRLSAPFRRDGRSVGIAALSLLGAVLYPDGVPVILIGAGICGIVLARPPERTAAVHVWPLFLYFLRTGLVIFGGGMVIVPLTQNDVVDHYHWLTAQQYVDAVGVGLIAPGPLVISSVYMGFAAAGLSGAAAAAAAIFLPSFAFVLVAAPLVRRISHSAHFRAFATGVAPAVVGTIVAASVPLFHACIGPEPLRDDIVKAFIFLISSFVLIRGKTNPSIAVFLAGVVGLIALPR